MNVFHLKNHEFSGIYAYIKYLFSKEIPRKENNISLIGLGERSYKTSWLSKAVPHIKGIIQAKLAKIIFDYFFGLDYGFKHL